MAQSCRCLSHRPFRADRTEPQRFVNWQDTARYWHPTGRGRASRHLRLSGAVLDRAAPVQITPDRRGHSRRSLRDLHRAYCETARDALRLRCYMRPTLRPSCKHLRRLWPHTAHGRLRWKQTCLRSGCLVCAADKLRRTGRSAPCERGTPIAGCAC